jgi:protein-L-isoaspartate(D-aspartate) O-methyltransferase
MTAVNIEYARENMIKQQVRTWDVLDHRILATMESTPRQDFVPAKYRNIAFGDVEIPIGHGEFMMQPKMEGRVLQSVDIQPTDRVLEIGTGSGYLTACLARLAHQVVSVEYHQDLSESAAANLEKHGIDNVTLRFGDAANGWNQDGPFDVVVVTASMPKWHNHFNELLRINGRLFVVVGTGDGPVMEARLITCVGEQDYKEESLFDTYLKPLIGMTKSEEFEF